jgi:pimeloyl-ACP methyl ester carboxylesterase
VAQALGALLDHLGRQTVLLVHSMSSPYGFRVLETHGHLIQALVAVAPRHPGNIQPLSDVVRLDETEMEIARPSVNYVIPRAGRGGRRRVAAARRDQAAREGAGGRFSAARSWRSSSETTWLETPSRARSASRVIGCLVLGGSPAREHEKCHVLVVPDRGRPSPARAGRSAA